MLLLAQKNYPNFFKSLKIIAVDEWHELIGSKRGVQVELAISRLMAISHQLLAISNEENQRRVEFRNLQAYNLQLTISLGHQRNHRKFRRSKRSFLIILLH